MNTRELIERWPGLDDDDRELLLSVVSTRGKWKGYLLASAPSITKHPKRWAAWQALVGYLAPARVAMWSLMFNTESRDLYAVLDGAIKDTKLDVALRPIEPPFRWNLYAQRYDTDAEVGLLAEWLTKQGR